LNKKILFISHFFKPETGAASIRIQSFVNSLRKAGFTVKVITPKPNYPSGKKYNGFSDFICRDPENNITYLPIYFTGKHTLIGRMLSYLSYFISSFMYSAIMKFKPDVIITSSPPIFTSLAAFLVSKIRGTRFIFDIRDIWPDIGIELGILKNSAAILYLRKIEKLLLNNADAIIVTAEGDKTNVLRKCDNPVNVIYNGADTNLFKMIKSEDRINIRQAYNLPQEKKILVYFGSLNYGMNDIDILGELLVWIGREREDVHFLCIGDGDRSKILFENIKDNIAYTHVHSLPSEELAKILPACDISIIPRKYIEKDTGGNLPVKCFESRYAGIPVLMSSIPGTEIYNIFEECTGGKIVEAGNINVLYSALIELLADPDLVGLGLKGRNYTGENFDRRKQAEKLADIIESL